MINLLNLTFSELELWVKTNLNEPSFRATQIWQWLWQKLAKDFSVMTNLSQKCRELLKSSANIIWPIIIDKKESLDGTCKFLLQLEDGACIETVLIPSDSKSGTRRYSLCISSQVGCAMRCTFCATGTMGFIRNMTMSEILGQILIAREYLNDIHIDKPIIKNIVFMGMGEPLLNIHELIRSLETLNNQNGLAFSPRRITVSTCGIENNIQILGKTGLAYLAISLHAPTQDLRLKIMPKAARYPLEKLISELKIYPLKKREKITFEYLLLSNINDQKEHAEQLANLVKNVNGKLNLIIYNPIPNSPYKAPKEKDILAFEKILWEKNITAIIRKSKGSDIKASCGQLWAKQLSSSQKEQVVSKTKKESKEA